MKRTALALTLILALLFSIAGTRFTEVASANPLPPYKPPTITVSSPSPTKAYNITSIDLKIKIQVFGYTYKSIESISSLNYTLDGKEAIPIWFTYEGSLPDEYFVSGYGTLSQLSNGNHTLIIQGETTYNTLFNKSVSFKVDVNPTISVLSPTDKTYTATSIMLEFTVSEQASWIGYCLDNQENVAVSGNTTLTGLSEGSHNLTVYARSIINYKIGTSNTTHFVVDSFPPNILFLSPENKTYDTTNLVLNFSVNESTSWIGYCLDGEANATITGNGTMPELPHGSHSIIIYANDTAGNIGASEKLYFSIEPFPTTLVIASTTSVAIIGVGTLVYFKKHKH